ncbi:MAG: hypothetical protein CL667_12890 [Balneola sp.]|nr:hypothetical protein [Balneola sp.]
MSKESPESFYPKNTQEWREWLTVNHKKKKSIWLILYKKNSDEPTISWSEAVDEALCFGWIDSTRRAIDDEKYMQYFCPRKEKSIWSKINKEKVKKLKEAGLMTKSGLKIIETAKQNGSWTILDGVEALIIPDDSEKEFHKNSGSKEFFLSLSKSDRKRLLYWLVSCKKKETREKRIGEIIKHAANNQKPPAFR